MILNWREIRSNLLKARMLEEVLKIVPTYPNSGKCGCGEGYQNECCSKLEDLMNDGQSHCIYDFLKIK